MIKVKFQIDEEILQVLNSIPDEKVNALEMKMVMMDCPTCEEKARLSFKIAEFNVLKIENGLANVIATLPCGHVFMIHVDKEFRVRGHVRINDEIHVTSEKIDSRYLREMESKLLSCHNKIINENPRDPRAYRIFQELGRIRKEIDKLH